jgi:hypothetical protein
MASGVMTSGGAPLCLRSFLRSRGPAPIAARRVDVGLGRLGTPLVMVGSMRIQVVVGCLWLGFLCVSSGSSCLWYTRSLMAHGGGMHSIDRPCLGTESSAASFR